MIIFGLCVVLTPLCSVGAQAMQMARCFNESWPCELKLLVNDCHSHTAALVHHLTGQTITIEKILPLQRYPLWM